MYHTVNIIKQIVYNIEPKRLLPAGDRMEVLEAKHHAYGYRGCWRVVEILDELQIWRAQRSAIRACQSRFVPAVV